MRGEKREKNERKIRNTDIIEKNYDNDIENSYSEWDKNKPKVMSKE